VLFLFDIDGTLLLKATDEHRDALHEAITEVWGVPDPGAVSVEAAGRTDQDIAREILLLSGVNRHIEDRFDLFREAAVRSYARRCPKDLSAQVAPGMPELLRELASDGATLSLVTGNLEPIARIKLRAAGIGHFFASGQGGFGSDHEERAMLPQIARRRAAQVAGRDGTWPRADTIVIGDTPRDIACARADGVAVIAIATGPYELEALCDADAVVSCPDDIPNALRELAALSR